MRKLLILIFLLSIIGAYAQDLKLANVDISKRAFCNRIAWMDGSKFAIIADNSVGGKHFAHHIYVYDKDSLLNKQKVASDYSLYSDYTIILGKYIFFCDSWKNDTDAYFLSITDAIDDNGKRIKTSINVFTIPDEGSLLFKSRYRFNCYAGVNKQRALLTYSNDYKASHPKSFLFRIMSEKGGLTLIDTLKFPYNDRECNIDDIIYDDGNEKIYLLSNIFALTQEKGKDASYGYKDFSKSVLGCYDLKSRTYTEVSTGIPAFDRNKIQHLVKKDTIVYASLKPDAADTNNWTASLMIVRKNPFEVADLKSCNLKSDAVINFFDERKRKAEVDHVVAAGGIIEYKKNCFNVGWANFFRLNNQDKGGQINGAVIAAGAMFGLVGGLIAGAATSGAGASTNVADYSGDALWLTYEEGSNEPLQKTFKHDLRDDRYDVFSYGAFADSEKVYCIYNKSRYDNTKSNVVIEQVNGNNVTVPLAGRLKNLNINTVHTQTLFTKDGVTYMLGEYDPDNDMRDEPLFSERKFVLLSIN